MKKFFKNTAVHLAILTSAASLLAALQPAVSAAEFLTTPSYYETGGNTAQSVDSSADFTLSPGEISFSENTSASIDECEFPLSIKTPHRFRVI